MSDPQKVLVAVDFSASSRRAAAWAYAYARTLNCEIHLLHVIERQWHLDHLKAGNDRIMSELDQVFEGAKVELATMAAGARAQVGKVFEHVAMGRPDREIVRLAGDMGADLIVMGTHGHTGLERVLVGSVAEYVVRRAPCTVVTVKAPPEDARP
jgi:nucleotide-binding universal stress UspA family protein